MTENRRSSFLSLSQFEVSLHCFDTNAAAWPRILAKETHRQKKRLLLCKLSQNSAIGPLSLSASTSHDLANVERFRKLRKFSKKKRSPASSSTLACHPNTNAWCDPVTVFFSKPSAVQTLATIWMIQVWWLYGTVIRNTKVFSLHYTISFQDCQRGVCNYVMFTERNNRASKKAQLGLQEVFAPSSLSRPNRL